MTTSTFRYNSIFLIYPILIISLCACFQFYKLMLQMYPSIITDQLMHDFHLTGVGLGNLAAAFYYTYVIMQFFVGVLLDRYSIRWLATSAIFVCALGVIFFSHSNTLMEACLARSLMGLGVAFTTITYLKLASVWFSSNRYAFVTGLLATAAMAGATFGEAPLSYMINDYGWRNCLYTLGIVGLFIGLLFFLIVRDRPVVLNKNERNSISFKEIFQIFKRKQNWILTLYIGLAFSPVAIFGGLWGNPFIQQAYQLDKTAAATLVSLVFIGLGIGSPLLGVLSDRLRNRKQVMMIGTGLSCLSLLFILYIQHLPILLLAILLFLFGFGLGSFMLVFTIGKELNNPYLTGTVVAMINASDAILDSITEPFIGKLLDLMWDGNVVNGIHYFSLHSYRLSLSILPLYLILAIVLIICIRDKKYK